MIASPPLPKPVPPITIPALAELSVISFTSSVPPNSKCGPSPVMRSLSLELVLNASESVP